MSPRVAATRQAVYCHNSAPFYRGGFREAYWEPRFFLFSLFYRYLYRVNLHANDWVIVQQDWLRQAFRARYRLSNLVVARPLSAQLEAESPVPSARKIFLYPALPRVFKNFETLCEAARIVQATSTIPFEVQLTVSGEESRFAAHLQKRYKHDACIHFIGRQSQAAMAERYRAASAVVFPSRLETWGLPISEAKAYGKPLLLADLPYAHETVGDYDRACFFDPESPADLARLMLAHLDDTLQPIPHRQPAPAPPLLDNWDDLIRFLTADLPACRPSKGKSR
jgi:glycosyltransferase involved in cell wall biosynthesis